MIHLLSEGVVKGEVVACLDDLLARHGQPPSSSNPNWFVDGISEGSVSRDLDPSYSLSPFTEDPGWYRGIVVPTTLAELSRQSEWLVLDLGEAAESIELPELRPISRGQELWFPCPIEPAWIVEAFLLNVVYVYPPALLLKKDSDRDEFRTVAACILAFDREAFLVSS